jgi:hypothetical protein
MKATGSDIFVLLTNHPSVFAIFTLSSCDYLSFLLRELLSSFSAFFFGGLILFSVQSSCGS